MIKTLFKYKVGYNVLKHTRIAYTIANMQKGKINGIDKLNFRKLTLTVRQHI